MNVSALRLIAFSSASQRLGPSLKFEGVLQQIVLARQCNCSQEVRKGGPAIHLYACFVGSLVVFFEHSKRSNSGSAQSRTLSCKYASVFFLINTWVARNKSISILQKDWCKTARFKNGCYTSNTLQDLVAPRAWIVRNEKLHPATHAV